MTEILLALAVVLAWLLGLAASLVFLGYLVLIVTGWYFDKAMSKFFPRRLDQ